MAYPINGRGSSSARLLRKEKSVPTKRYHRILPDHPNGVLVYLSKTMPIYTVTGEKMDPELRRKLKERNISPVTYKRILLNHTIVTLDELHHMAQIFGCKVTDLI